MTHTTIEKEDKTMNENEREFFTLVDEDGSEIEFEKIGEITLNEKVYFAMIPAEAAENAAQNDGGFCEYVVLRLEKDEDGEWVIYTVHLRVLTKIPLPIVCAVTPKVFV